MLVIGRLSSSGGQWKVSNSEELFVSINCALIISGVTKHAQPHCIPCFCLSTDNINCISKSLREQFPFDYIFSSLAGLRLLARITMKRILRVKLKFRHRQRWSPCDCGMTPCELTLFFSLSLSSIFSLQAQKAWIERNFLKRECIHIFPTKDPTR